MVEMLLILALYLNALGVYYCFGALQRLGNILNLLLVRLNTLLELHHHEP